MGAQVSIKQLRALLEVAKSGSFATAASRLCVTPSALTSSIQQFESAVGVRMFDRTTRKVAVTPYAAEFLARAERLVNGLDGALSDLQSLAQGRRGHIRIGAAASVISQLLVPVLRSFRAQYPEITTSLRNPAAQESERLVLDGEVDFAIDSRYQNDSGLSYTPLLSDTYGVACHRSAPILQLADPLTWKSLTWGRYVGFSEDTGIGHFLRAHLPTFAPLHTDHDQIEGTSYLFDLLAEGDCFTVLPALSFQRNKNPELRWLELDAPRLTREICVMTRPLRSLSPTAQHLLNLLLAEVRSCKLPRGVAPIPA